MSRKDKNGQPRPRRRDRCAFCGCSHVEHGRIRDVLVTAMGYYGVENTKANRLAFVGQLVQLIEASMPEKKEGDR